MKNKAVILVLMFVVSCNLIPKAGTLGGGNTYKFNCSEKLLNKCLDSIEKNDIVFTIPEKWKEYNDWEQTGYGFLYGKVFYMRKSKALNFNEEMYYVTVSQESKAIKVRDSAKKDTIKAKTAIRAIFRMIKNKPRWLYCDSINSDEMEIIEKRFQKSILDKVAKSGCGCTQYKKIDENKAGILIQ